MREGIVSQELSPTRTRGHVRGTAGAAELPVENLSMEDLYERARRARDATDGPAVERFSRALIERAEPAGDVAMSARGQLLLGFAMVLRADSSRGRAALKKAQHAFESSDDLDGRAAHASVRGTLAFHVEDNPEAARRWSEECLALEAECTDPHYLGMALANLAEIARLGGDYRWSLRNSERAIAVFRDLDDCGRVAWQLSTVALTQLLSRDNDAFFASMCQAFNALRRDRIPRFVARYFDVAFIAAARFERWEDAARLSGFTDHFRHRKSQVRLNGLMPWTSEPIERLHKNLSDERLNELLLEGEGLTLDRAQDVALRAFSRIAP